MIDVKVCRIYFEIILSGLPTTIELSGATKLTNAPGAIKTFDQIVILPTITKLAQSQTIFPIVRTRLHFHLYPSPKMAF